MRPLFAALGLSLSVAVASAAAAPPPLAPLRLASPVLERGEVREAQTLLRSLGYDVGPIDGRVGPRVRSALTAFQRDSALAPTGQLDDFMLRALRDAVRLRGSAYAAPAPAPAAPPRAPEVTIGPSTSFGGGGTDGFADLNIPVDSASPSNAPIPVVPPGAAAPNPGPNLGQGLAIPQSALAPAPQQRQQIAPPSAPPPAFAASPLAPPMPDAALPPAATLAPPPLLASPPAPQPFQPPPLTPPPSLQPEPGPVVQAPAPTPVFAPPPAVAVPPAAQPAPPPVFAPAAPPQTAPAPPPASAPLPAGAPGGGLLAAAPRAPAPVFTGSSLVGQTWTVRDSNGAEITLTFRDGGQITGPAFADGLRWERRGEDVLIAYETPLGGRVVRRGRLTGAGTMSGVGESERGASRTGDPVRFNWTARFIR